MRLSLGFGLFLTLTLTELLGPGVARAATAECMGPDGACEVSNNAGDFVQCECTDGSGGGGGGGNDWAGLSEVELQPICEEQLALLCGPPLPPDGIPCSSPAGSCFIDNDPEDMLACECADGSGGVVGGGNAWAGLSEMELLDQCEAELALLCGGGPPPPPPPAYECSSRLGVCSINNVPLDILQCTCASGDEFEGGGGNDWAEYSEEELIMECEQQLADGCAVGSETEGESTDTGEPGDTGDTGTGGSTGGAGSTGEPGDTGVDDSGGASEGSTSSTVPPDTTGDDATGASEGSDGGADGGGGGSGGCSVAPRSAPGGWALVLLGLVGVGWRRRRAA